MSEITAILVAYNSAGIIGQALHSLCGQPEIASVVVVDNCSTDDTCELIRRDFPDVKVIENPKNDGFGRANNRALKSVQTPYALLVNPDAVLKEGALKALLAAANNYPDAGIIAPVLYDAQGELDQSYKRNVFAREKKRGEFIVPEGDLCAEFLSGAVWLFNMKLMKQVGFFDPAIFLYYEDDDLCLRVQQAGYGLVLATSAAAMHVKGASSGSPKPEAEFDKQKHIVWSRLYIEKKYHGERAARRLALRLRFDYGFKLSWYYVKFDMRKINRYRGRLAGVFEFSFPKKGT
jgi:GT2 family glycosyltransferase